MKKEIIERFKTYHFKDECFFEINPDYNFNKGFVLKVVFGDASNFKDGSTIIKTPGFELTYHKKDIRNRDCFTDSEKSDRVWIYEKDGFVELLEMKMVFVCPHTKVEREMIVDLVLNNGASCASIPIISSISFFTLSGSADGRSILFIT